MIDWSKDIEVSHKGKWVSATVVRYDPNDGFHPYKLDYGPYEDQWFTAGGKNCINGDAARNTPAVTAPTPMEFGPEIKVDGKRPEWLEDDVRCTINQEYPQRWLDHANKSVSQDWCWGVVKSIRVPADHAYYANASAPSYIPTPTPDERAVAPEIVEKMVTLCRAIAEAGTDDRVLRFEEARSEARAIVAELEPVDPDLVEARKMAADIGIPGRLWTQINEGAEDDQPLVFGIRAGIAKGRQLQRDAEQNECG